MTTHRIGRQVLEVVGGTRETAAPLGDAMRALYVEHLLPVIDEVCSALAGPDRLLRIDRLEIDLGALPWDSETALPATAVERLGAVLPQRLVGAASAAPAVAGDAEAIERFAFTGTLPWWTTWATPAAASAAIDRVLAEAGVAAELLRRLAGRADAWRRLLRHGSDARWDRWIAAAVADWRPLAGAPMRALSAALVADEASATDRRPAAEAAMRCWPLLLAAAGRHGIGAADLLAAGLALLAPQFGLEARELWRRWRRATIAERHDWGALGTALDHRFDAQAPARGSAAVPAAALADAQRRLAALLARWSDSAAGRALWGRLAAVLHLLPPALMIDAAKRPSAPRRVALLDAALSQGLIGAHAVDEWLAAVGSTSAEPERDECGALLRDPARRRGVANVPLDDTISVGNAGIVLLWPFVSRLFERLGLVSERRFDGDAAAQQAARLLHYAASGDADPAEFMLPLPKLLCGLDLVAPLDPAEALPAAACAEADAMLMAAIAQAPVLRAMTIDGFRGSFLLRQGQLGERDGHHLLRVERQGWDLVIERFPWSARVVRLPWMSSLLEVEW